MRRAPLRRWAWHPVGIIAFIAVAFSGCSGNGCSCMSPIPGGFPSAQRTKNAAQVRVSDTGIAQITKDPAGLLGALLPGGGSFNVPASCTGSTPVCCPGGNPQSPCGPIVIDLAQQPGDAARLEVKPVQGASRLDVTVRARLKTMSDVPVSVLGSTCGLAIDTAPGPKPDIQLDIPVGLVQDTTAGTTRIDAASVTVTNLTTDDVKLNGGAVCFIANLGLGLFLNTLTTTFQDAIKGAINDQACKKCPSGDKTECGPFATACTSGVCQEGNACLQELGITGRMAGTALFSSLSPGTTGSIDLYEGAGGYATTDSGGVALGLLGGILPSGAPRDHCGPMATAPAPVTIPVSSTFQANKQPNGDPFDIAIGVHKNQLDRFAYSGYDGGLLCLTVGTRSVDLINSDTFGLFLRSLSNLTSNDTVPMAVGLRPQAPPVITLGKNVFVDDGSGGKKLMEPLLDVKFTALEIDIFAEIEGQYVRLFTLVSDLELPVGLQVGADGLTPVLGDLTTAFTNISVKNSEPMVETPDELAKVFPMILQLALPKLAGALGAIKVPTVGGLQIDVTSITAVDNDTFLAIFGNLKVGMAQVARAETTARVMTMTVPRTDVFADPTLWSPARRPQVALELGGAGGDGRYEWQYQIDDGLWSTWSSDPQPVVSSELFWLQGVHEIDVRARLRDAPLTADPTPATVIATIDTQPPVPRLDQVGDVVRIDGRDAVAKDRVQVRWRLSGSAWREAPAPVEVDLGGAPPEALEVQVIDQVGNVAPTRGTDAIQVAEFHGTPGTGGGCACGAGRGGGEGAGAISLVVGVVLVGGRRRRRAWRRAARAIRRALPAIAIVLIGGSLEGCSCSHSACGDKACQPGEVAHGAIGRWNAIATDGTRTVVTTYDQTLGDLVVADLKAGAEPSFEVVDGIPAGVSPMFDPSTYRGGVPDAGPDMGAWSSVALVAGKVRVAYQDRDNHRLRYAAEDGKGGYAAHDVDAPMDFDQVGAYASLAIGGDGKPAIAYIATGVTGDKGTRTTELRLARASSATPTSTGDWTITTVASGPRGCAGLCGSTDKCVKAAVAGDPETCATPTTDCNPACSSGVCVAGACLTEDTNEITSLPGGVGMFANLLVLGDGRLAIVHYDGVRTALVALIESAPGSSAFTEAILDGAGAEDRGAWASAAVDTAGTIHVAYQDALTDEVFYNTLAGTTVGTPELVDDGVRAGDRTHNVGGGATLWLDGGSTPRIAYQDGISSDLVTASRGASGWSHTDAQTGPILDGFHLAAPPQGGWLVWDGVDQNQSPASTLVVKQNP